MDALDVIIENQAWTPDTTIGLLRRFINGRGLNADCAQFLQRVAVAESAGNSTLDVPVTAGSSPQALRLALDLSFGEGPVDSHHIRASVQTAISQFVAEGAITPDDEAHAALENWSVSIVPAEEA